jgi:photosystem II stability/assembly factor-like uncharacterized protein
MSNFSCEIAYPTVTNGNTVNLDPTQTWTSVTDVPSLTPWSSVSISSNGVNAIVCSGYRDVPYLNYGTGIDSYIYYSTDSLVTWNLSTITTKDLFSVSISDTGYALACGNYSDGTTTYGYIYLSTNNGQTWTTVKSDSSKWQSVSISKNGQYAIASASDNVYYSQLSDSFATWLPTTGINTTPGITWKSVSISSTGQYGIASNAIYIYYSSDFGHTWSFSNTSYSSATNWLSVSISSTGQYGIATNISSIYYSSDFGHTWTISNSPSGLTWQSVSISSTGKYGIACDNGGGGGGLIYYSSDFGHTWTLSNSVSNINLNSISISGTGQYGLACVYGGSIYILNG